MYRKGWPCISFDWQNLRSFISYSFLLVAGNYDSYGYDKYFSHLVSICTLLSQLLHLISLG